MALQEATSTFARHGRGNVGCYKNLSSLVSIEHKVVSKQVMKCSS